MPSSEKTTKLNLNSWIGTDKPMRSDFVYDNEIIDATLGSHIEYSSIHLSTSDRSKLESPFVTGRYTGDGAESKIILLSFTPSIFVVYYREKPFNEYDSTNSYIICNAAVATASGVSSGVVINENQIIVSQTQTTPTDGIFVNLNKNNAKYAYIAFV